MLKTKLIFTVKKKSLDNFVLPKVSGERYNHIQTIAFVEKFRKLVLTMSCGFSRESGRICWF